MLTTPVPQYPGCPGTGSQTRRSNETAEDAWVHHVGDVAAQSLRGKVDTWYLGANIPGKPRVFMPYLGFPPYAEKCKQVADNDYQGFELSA